MKTEYLYLTGIALIIFFIYWYFNSDYWNLKCIISTKDGNRYCVREREQMDNAANLLAEVTDKMKRIVEYIKNNHPNDKRAKKLIENFNPQRISETLPTSELTAYSENKGEKIAFCLNKKKKDTSSKLIDIETLTFVALHELSHLATDSIGHKTEFWQNFKWILENAKEAGIHTPIDYKSNPQEYCGMEINDNPYFDLV